LDEGWLQAFNYATKEEAILALMAYTEVLAMRAVRCYLTSIIPPCWAVGHAKPEAGVRAPGSLALELNKIGEKSGKKGMGKKAGCARTPPAKIF
jgi:hypothetical protein